MSEALKQIGSVDKAVGAVSVRHPDGGRDSLQAGAPVYQGDLIETGADGRVGVVFVDQSTFSLGPKGRMSMDEMVYDPATPQTGHSTVAALQGAFSFVSGQIAKSTPDAMQVKTPVMTIGVRGTTVAGMAASEGSANTITLLRDGSGTLGQVTITNAAGSITLNGESHTIQISSFVQAPPRPTAMSAADVQALYGNALAAQPLPPANPPANPPPPDNGGQQGGPGDGNAPQQEQTAAEGADPTDPGQIVQFINASLNDIVDAGVAEEISEMLGDLGAWTVLSADAAEQDITSLVAEIFAAEQDFWAMLDDVDVDDLLDKLEQEFGDVGEEWYGTHFDDVHHGTQANDYLNGIMGDDQLFGEGGRDELDGGYGADTLYGGDGDDILSAVLDGSTDSLYGDDGSDTLSYAFEWSNTVTVTLYEDHTATVTDGAGKDYFYTVENIMGSNVDSSGDTLTGNSYDNTIWGGRGDDVLTGAGGNDMLDGGEENDILIGGAGDDTLIGGAGTDLFQFLAAFGSLGTDTIMDFASGGDVIQLKNTIFGLGIGGLTDGTNYFETSTDFLAGTSFAGSGAGVIARYDADEGAVELYYSTDLSNANSGNSYQLATLAYSDLSSIQASDVVGI